MPAFPRTDLDDWLEEFAAAVDGTMFYSRLAGAGHLNADGTSRQATIAELEPRTELQLEHEPDNTFDPNAVRVLLPDGRQLGYLDARLAGETVRRWRRGGQTRAVAASINGRAGQSLGVTLAMIKIDPRK